MKTYTKKLAFMLVTLMLSAIYTFSNTPLNTLKKSVKLSKEEVKQSVLKNSFYENHEENWKNTEKFNTSFYWNQQEYVSVVNNSTGQTVTITNRKVASSTDDSYQKKDNKNFPTSIEGGDIRWHGYRFVNLNIPSNAIITNAKLKVYGYDHGNTTATIYTEEKKSPSAFGSNKKNISDRNKTTSTESWYIPNLNNNGFLATPNFKNSVQEAVNSQGGLTHLSVLVYAPKKWEGWNFDDAHPACFPYLDITYTVQSIETTDDTASATTGSSVSVSIGDNDSNIPANGVITITDQPNNGSVSIDNNGTANDITDDKIVYTPNANFSGTDTFDYRVCTSNNSDCDTSTVTVSVTAPIDPCDAVASGNLDTDNDGVSDICDLDDDNDGILDTDENGSCNSSSNHIKIGDNFGYGSISNSDDGTYSTSLVGTTYTIDFNENNGGSISTVNLNGNNEQGPVFKFNGGSGDSSFIDITFSNAISGATFKLTDLDEEEVITVSAYDENNNLISLGGSSYVTSIGSQASQNGNVFNNTGANNVSGDSKSSDAVGSVFFDFTGTLIKRIKVNVAHDRGSSIRYTQISGFCTGTDTDKDGIIDSLDTDSDNDGCPDATEAANNLTTTATLNGGSNGGSSANLGTNVNANGIPTAAATSATTGQSNTNATKTAEQITINTAPSSQTIIATNSVTFSVSASGVKTTNFTAGSPNYGSGSSTTNNLSYKWYKNTDPNTTLSTSSSLTINNVAASDAGDYTVLVSGSNNNCGAEETATLTVDATDPCDAVASGNPDTDGDGVSDMCDLDDDNDGILDTEEGEGSCDQSNVANSTSGTGQYQDQLYFFNWTDASFANGVHNGDSQTFTLPGNLVITATISNAVNGSSYVPTDMQTWSGSTLYKLYNTSNTKEAFYGSNGQDASFTVNFTAVKNGNPYPLDLLTLDPESTDANEHLKFTTNGENWKVLETIGNGGTWTGINTKTVKTTNTNQSQGNTIYYSYNASKIDVELNAGGRQGIAFGFWLKCDTDNDGILNHRDTDSDNDGCPDVTEAANNLTPTGTLNGSGNLGTTSNNNGIPLPLGTANGNETVGQAITSAVTIAEQITVDTAPANKTADENTNTTFSVTASGVKTTTFNSGNPVYTSPNGISSTASLTYKWFKNTDPNTILSTTSSLTINNVATANAGDYTVQIIGENNNCGVEESATLTVNYLPTAEDDTITGITEDSSNNSINVLADNSNGADSFGDDGPNTGSISLPSGTTAQGGTVTIDDQGNNDPTDDVVLYTPAANFNGTDSFDYTITDSNGDTSTATVTVTVDSENDPPVATNDNYTTPEDTPKVLMPLTKGTNDSDPDGDTLVISAINGEPVSLGTAKTITVPNGTVTYSAAGAVTFTPNPDFNGVVQFPYTISDGNGGTDTATETITVTPSNDVPTAIDDNYTTDEDTPVTLTPLTTGTADSDPDGDTLVVTSINGEPVSLGTAETITVPNGTVDYSATGVITFTPDANYSGTVTFPYTISDGNGETAQADEIITINPVNDAPTAVDDSYTTDEDTPVTLIPLIKGVSDSDPENDTLVVTSINGEPVSLGTAETITVPNGTIDYSATGVITFTPDANYNGTVTFPYTISDGNGGTDTATETIVVNPINDAPTATDDSYTTDEETPVTLTPLTEGVADSDPDGDTLVVASINGEPVSLGTAETITVPNGTVNYSATGVITFTPDANYNGTVTFPYTISDGNGGTDNATETIVVNPVNDAPTATNDSYTTNEDAPVTLTPLIQGAPDSDPDGDTLVVASINGEPVSLGTAETISVPNGTVDYSATGIITFTPDANYNGTVTFPYTISDGNGGTDNATETIVIAPGNDSPTATDDSYTTNEDTPVTLAPLTEGVADSDPDGDTLVISSINGEPVSLGTAETITVPNGTVNYSATGVVTFTPTTNFTGTTSFPYMISDGNGGTASATETIVINPVNDAPTATDDSYTTNEDTPVTLTPLTEGVADSDPDGDTLVISSINGEPVSLGTAETISVPNGTVNYSATGVITFTPDANYNGTVTFPYTISDGNGGTDSATETIVIAPRNDAPTATDDNYTTDEDTPVTLTPLTETVDTDPDNDTLIVTSINGESVSLGTAETILVPNGTVDYSATGVITFTPDTNFNGTVSFPYTISDGNGGTDSATETIVINPVNDAPTATDDSYTTNEDTPVTLTPLTETIDTDPEGDTLVVSSINGEPVSLGTAETISVPNGTVNYSATGVIIFTPDANYNGTVTFPYTISDGNGGTDTANETIVIAPGNDTPTATDDSYSTNEDTPVTLTPLTEGVADSDPDGDTLVISSINGEPVSLGTAETISVPNGTVNYSATGVVTFTPDSNYNGTVTFPYTISDGNGGTDTANETIVINPINDVPTATNDSYTTNEDTSVTLTPLTEGVADSDPDGDTLVISSINGEPVSLGTAETISVPNGTVNYSATGVVTFTPNPGYNGTVTFPYTISDGNGGTDNATETIVINPVNDAPTATNDSYTTDEDNSVTLTPLTEGIADSDPDGDTLVVSSINGEPVSLGTAETITVPNGTVDYSATGVITFTPDANYNGTVTFPYTISDGNGGTDTATETIVINPINDEPTATDDSYTTDEDTPVTLTPLTEGVADSDPDGDTLVVASINGEPVSLGTAETINVPNGTVNYSATGVVTFTPDANYNGTVQFPYTISDGNGGTDNAIETITVLSINDFPDAVDVTVANPINENSANNVINVLPNDTFGGDGPNTGSITLPSSNSANGGSVTVDNNGTPNDPTDDVIIYTPLIGFTGADTFQYTITDSNGDSDTATVTLNVVSAGTPYIPTLPAQCFNVFVEQNISVTNGATNGSVAAGGDLTINGNYGISSQDCGCYSVNGNEIGLLIDGKVNYPVNNSVVTITNPNQYVKIGQKNGGIAWYQNPLNAPAPIRITPNSNYNASSHIQIQGNTNSLNVSATNNPVFEGNLIDFASAFQALKTNSASIATNSNNAQLTDAANNSIPNTALPNTVKINLQNGTNYLNVTGTDLNNVDTFTFNQQPDANKVLIINIDASGTFNWDVWQQNNAGLAESQYILYNFYNTTELNIIGSQAIAGTILAPFADINKTVNTENITGQVIAKSLNHNGGEIQCASFVPNVVSPPSSGVPPTADFSVNDDEQCLANNEFIFTNNSNTGAVSQPTDPITYTWDFGDGTTSSFMNPKKTYSGSGTYTVTLTATNTFGSDTTTTQVIVSNPPNHPVITKATIASAPGTVTREFTLENDTYFDSFSWELVGSGANLFPNQKTVTFDFTTDGSYTVIVTGIKNGCSQTQSITVAITSGEVTGGNGGGVESESLGDAISKIYVKRKKNSVPTQFVKSEANRYNKQKLIEAQPYQGKGQTMLDMFPKELVAGNIANVTSPTDILDYTVADEVLSVDFSVDGKTKGVVLGIKTSDKIYNHTKASCDRLRGAEILNIQTVQLEGYNFLMQGIKQRNGVVEYAISFAVAKNNNDKKYTIQTNWYVNEYIKFNDVYNFQVWSTNPDDTQKLVKDVLANLNGFIPVKQVEKQKVPKTYAAKISRVKNELVILLRSTEKGLNTELTMQELYSETANNVKHRYNPLNTKIEQTLRVDIADGYEYDGLLKVDGSIQDAFYHADGNWGLDFDSKYTEVQEYFISNNFDREYKDDEHAINRNVKIKAVSNYDYLGIYKSLLPGNLSADYSQYKYLTFTAKGSGLIELGLIKSSVQEWKEQYRVMVDLSEEEQTYYVPFDIFTSTGTTDKIIADDLTTLTFTFLPVEANTKDLNLEISNVSFAKSAPDDKTVGVIEEFENNFMAYPNPTKGDVNVLLYSKVDTKATVSLYDVTGKEIYKAPVQLTAGKNEIDFNVKVKPGIMFLKVNSKEINYGTSKIIFR